MYMGEVTRSRSRDTGNVAVLIDTHHRGGDWVDGTDGRWVTICDTHNTTCNHATRAIAYSHMATMDWCEECMAGPTLDPAGLDAAADVMAEAYEATCGRDAAERVIRAYLKVLA